MFQKRKTMKNTKPRQTIYEFLTKQKMPVSAIQIYEELKNKSITLSTIYRTLATFEQNKIIEKMENKNGVGLYYVHKNSHTHYLECTDCHKRLKLDFCPYNSIKKELKEKNGFEISDNQILYGLCKQCSKK